MQNKSIEISASCCLVGVKDPKRRLFDGLIALPEGTSYNSYLVFGNKKLALIDTVNPGFEKKLVRNINAVAKLKNLDYLIMNHAEPDHASAIPYIFLQNGKVKLVTSLMGGEMAKRFYNIPQERIMIVKDQERLDLGGKTLRFIEAPMLHWPETMFTYLEEEKVLFSCDFFGAHMSSAVFDNEAFNLEYHAQRYYGEIMMPFRPMAKRAMEKIADLPIAVIAPSHGPIYKDPPRILEQYKKWVVGETKKKVLLVYLSMWGSSKKMIEAMTKVLTEQKIEFVCYDLTASDIGDIAKDLVDARALVFAAPTVLGELHPVASFAANLVKTLKPPLKHAVFMSSCGWAGGAGKNFKEITAALSLDLVKELEIKGPPTAEDLEAVKSAGLALIGKLSAESEI
ncbi:MAG: Flavodoxin [Parcubacteria group bacterium GW2011_GWE2_39_37]|uniref:Flavodoxin n=1 Tax=Candidatus Falkowbacteria bacterium GW2011_GWF2_39_8 TaxID=1618642 RepID=A0A0G0PUV7_9BACT|nr:MAG: Flavodoxin [Parcubacteria group bacterium GW2011_GWE2_39_37]KKR31668.1 MAG: Flavodoxin [Candidatus Falkowbacteria bacterium GW2011_GWF2_39_8]